jgi:hypothetical protein
MSESVVARRSPEEQELLRKREQLVNLHYRLAEVESDLATLNLRLAAFEDRYLSIVGRRYAELDGILAEIAAIRAEGLPPESYLHTEAQTAKERAQSSADAVGGLEEQPTRRPPDPNLKSLYREIARLVHPDLATDERDRERRERLMRDANLAYEAGDRDWLERILRECKYDAASVVGIGVGDDLVRVIRQIALVEERITEVERLLREARIGDRYLLMLEVERAEAEGRDLLEEMAEDVDRQIVVAEAQANELRERRA